VFRVDNLLLSHSNDLEIQDPESAEDLKFQLTISMVL